MKKYVLILGLFLFVQGFVFTQQEQKPDKVYSIKTKCYPVEWYEQQAKLWKNEINKNKKNADAWLNFYTANRMYKMLNSNMWLDSKKDYFQELNSIVDSLGKELPDSFEYNYLKYRNSFNISDENFKYLMKAYNSAPERSETYEEFMTYYEVKNDLNNLTKYSKKLFDANGISLGILAWNYNVLMSLDENAILITNGDNDTYPIWLIQNSLNIRPDVKVFNISLLTIDKYRKTKFSENNIPEFDFKFDKEDKSKNITVQLYKSIIDHLVKNHGKNPLYFALTLYIDYYKKHENNLFLTGTAFKYSSKNFDNIAVMKKNYEQKFLMDYLKIELQKDISESVLKQINLNYLPMLIKLRSHYLLSGENFKIPVIDNLILKISSDTSMEEEVKKAIQSGNFDKIGF